MPLDVFGNSPFSSEKGNKVVKYLIVQKLFLGTIYIESNMEDNFDMRNQFRTKNLRDPVKNTDAVCKLL